MQKKLIALAVVAAFSAPAFADTTVYGILDAAVGAISATGQKSDLLTVSGGQSTSRIGVKGSEDLPDGLKLVYQLEYALDGQRPNAGTSTTADQNTSGIGASRMGLLGLAGGFGTVATGYLQTTGYDWSIKFDPLAGSVVSPLDTVNQKNFYIGDVAIAARAPRALAYISPTINGFSAAVNYTTSFDRALGNLTLDSNNTTTLKTTAFLVSGNYAAGPLAAGLVYFKSANATTGAATVSEYAFGGSYDLSVAKLYATYQNSKASTATSANTAYSMSAILPVSTGAFGAAFAGSKLAVADTGATSFTVGYLHTLSASTNAYIAYQSVKNGSATSAFSADRNAVAGSTAAGWLANGGSSSLIAVGLRKKF